MESLRRDFERDGFVVLEGVIEPVEVERVRASARAIVEGFDFSQHRTVFQTDDRDRGRDDAFFASATGVHCFLESDALTAEGQWARPQGEAVNKIGHALHDRVEAFGSFSRLPLFGEVLRAVGIADPLLWQTMYIFKQPRIGGEVRWHQDASYLITRPASVVGIWIALEEAHVGNGCLWMAPGSHRSPLRELYTVDWERRAGTLATLDETPWPTLDEARPLELSAGSVVVFHDHLPHCSARNESDSSRHALTLHATPCRADWAPENWLQREGLEPFAL